MVLLACDTGFHAYGMHAFTHILGMSKEEAERICEASTAGGKDKGVHLYSNLWVPFLLLAVVGVEGGGSERWKGG